MAIFTCITRVREVLHLTQRSANSPAAALREHIAALPYDDGAGPFGEELEWLLRVSSGHEFVEMLPVGPRRGMWLWLGDTRYHPYYITYVVRTDVRVEV